MIKRKQPELTKKNLVRARRMLFDTIDYLDQQKIVYHLEGGTLLGIVRDGELLPWDHDVDISILANDVDRFMSNLRFFYSKGYKISFRKSATSIGPFVKGELSLFKIKRFIPSLIKFFYPWYLENYVVLDIFVKAKDETYTYWQAQGKLLRVENKYYESFETINYRNEKLKIPNNFKDYLTQKYGDWSVPVKEWECGKDEKAIC